tara:strand:+ start:570 stop:1145 length:576 start_codon:yes stop_codon:yes gene_type:complete
MGNTNNSEESFLLENENFKQNQTDKNNDEIIKELLLNDNDFQFFEENLKQFAYYLSNDLEHKRQDFIRQEYEYLKNKFKEKHDILKKSINEINEKVINYYNNQSNYNTIEYINSFNQLVKKYKKQIINKFKITDNKNKYYVYYTYLKAHNNIYNNIDVNPNFNNENINSYLKTIKTNINDINNLKQLKFTK